jgi:hypothetical protein
MDYHFCRDGLAMNERELHQDEMMRRIRPIE